MATDLLTVSERARTALMAFDLDLCRRATGIQRRASMLTFFRVVSRLGDGLAWFLLGGAVAVTAQPGATRGVLRLALTAVLAAAISRSLRGWASRPRPYAIGAGIAAGAAALDPWSFPSGHTLHAVAFQLVLVPTHPLLALALTPWTLAVALSRVALGLHYPSDVVAGGALGALVAAVVVSIL